MTIICRIIAFNTIVGVDNYKLYLRIDLKFFSVHEEINSKMGYIGTHCVTREAVYAKVCTTLLSLFRMNRTKNCDQSL
jgi:hypothetical protein